MLEALKSWYDGFRGAGEYAITVPPMDGALRPNTALDQAQTLLDWPSPDNIAVSGDHVWFSSGPNVLRFTPGDQPENIQQHAADVTAMAAHDDTLVVALTTGEIVVSGGPHNGKRIGKSAELPINCPISLTFSDANTLLIGNGSDKHDATQWRHDLLKRTSTGSVWRLDLESGKAKCLARQLAWPRGLAVLNDGSLLVSEAWRCQLIVLRPGTSPEPVLTDLPAYPGGLTPSSAGGFWLALFAPRRRLTELVMREPAYRDRMMAEIEPEYWISPSLRPMESYYEPLQGGTLKKLAMLKPWAPSRSYGLVLELSETLDPIRSFHSRADGRRHGISSCVEFENRLLIAATGGDAVIALSTED